MIPEPGMYILLGNGDGTFPNQSACSVGSAPSSIAVADINGDSQLDLVVTNSNNNSISFLLGIGNGSFHDQQVLAVRSSPLFCNRQ